MDVWLVFMIYLLFLIGYSSPKNTVKVCVVAEPTQKQSHTTKYCNILAGSKNLSVSCVYAPDKLQCLRFVSERVADFTILNAEDLYFATLWEGSSVLVVAELRAVKEDDYKFGTVVVINNDLNMTGVDLWGRKLCHPGLKTGAKWNDLFAQYLEERVAPRNCEPELTVLEDRTKTSSEFFGYSCKAGPWTSDVDEDIRLKNEYSSLCAICEMGYCGNSDKYRGSAGSLLCLTDGVGDVLWARYDDVKSYFKKFSIGISSISPLDYSLLCEDGTLQPLDTKEPCYWLTMPWQVVAANRKSAFEVQKVIHDVGSSDGEQAFIETIESYLHFIVNLEVPKTPEDYLKQVPGYLSAMEVSQGNCKPSHSIRLCTSHPIEQSKCTWTAMAALTVPLQPPLECVERGNVTSCIEAVADGLADVAVVPPDYVADATTKYGLSTFTYEIPSQAEGGYMLNAYSMEDSNLKTLYEFKGKKACFTRVGGVGWNAALYRLHGIGLIESQCRGDKSLLEFFGEICVANNTGLDVPSCCKSARSNGSDEEKVLDCLFERDCHIAFLDSRTVQEDSQKKEYKSEILRPIALGTNENSRLWSYPSYLMVSSQTNSVKYQEVVHLFSQIGETFGRTSKNDNKMFEIFGSFNGVKNVIFKDTSVTFSDKNFAVSGTNYLDVLDSFDVCSSAVIVHLSFPLIILQILVLNLFSINQRLNFLT